MGGSLSAFLLQLHLLLMHRNPQRPDFLSTLTSVFFNNYLLYSHQQISVLILNRYYSIPVHHILVQMVFGLDFQHS